MSKDRFTKLEFDEETTQSIPADRVPGKLQDRPGTAAGGHDKDFVSQVKDAPYHLQQAEKHELAGDHESGLRSYSAALGENPLLLDAWVGQVLMLLEMGELPEARIWSDKALETFPEHPVILAAKAVALYRMGRTREARDLSDAAVQAKGESDLVWLCRGELMLKDSGPASEHCFRNALRMTPHKPLTQLRMGACLYRYQKYHLALATLQEATSALPRSAWAWYLLGCTQAELGFVDQAKISFKTASSLSPRNAEYRQAITRTKSTVSSSLAGLFRRLFGK